MRCEMILCCHDLLVSCGAVIKGLCSVLYWLGREVLAQGTSQAITTNEAT